MTPDREALERELANRLQELAPPPSPDALSRATSRIAATTQRHTWMARLADAVRSVGWARAGATIAVAAAALVVGVFIGQADVPFNVGGSAAPSASAPVSTPSPEANHQWQEPASYSFVFADNRCGGGERGYWGNFRVFVEGGVTIEYVALDETAEGFRGAPSEIPTLASLLDRVQEARETSDPVVLDGRVIWDGAPPEVRLVSDPVDGHPLEIYIDWVPAAIDDEECYVITEYALAPPTPSPSPPHETEDGWDEPDHYTFVFEASCGLRALHGRFRAHVADGVTYRYERLGDDTSTFPLEPEQIPTLGEMLARGREAQAHAQSSVELVTDPVDGRPVRIEIDWIENAIDDEECYEILSYEPLEESD